MIKCKQLILYTMLLGAYSNPSMCMEKQEPENLKHVEQASTEQKLDFDALPLNVQEEIISYLPTDNLYRALWSRCHNASPEFYKGIVNAYLESHFVPQEFIDKAINQDFVHFHGLEKEKQEFQEKIKRALQCYDGDDTEIFSDYTYGVNNRELNIFDIYRLSRKFASLILGTQDKNRCMAKVKKLKEGGKLTQVKKALQWQNSYLKCCRACLPLTQNKAQFIRLLHTLVNKYAGLPAVLAIMTPINYSILHTLWELGYLGEQTGEQSLNWSIIGLLIAYGGSVSGLAEHCVKYACNKLNSSFDRYLQMWADKIEEMQTRISRVLDAIDQLKKA